MICFCLVSQVSPLPLLILPRKQRKATKRARKRHQNLSKKEKKTMWV